MSKLFTRRQRFANFFRNLLGLPIPLPVLRKDEHPACCGEKPFRLREWWSI